LATLFFGVRFCTNPSCCSSGARLPKRPCAYTLNALRSGLSVAFAARSFATAAARAIRAALVAFAASIPFWNCAKRSARARVCLATTKGSTPGSSAFEPSMMA
jgi:hypothetical protein